MALLGHGGRCQKRLPASPSWASSSSLFLIGLELSYQRLLTMRRLVFGLGSLQVILSTAVIGGVVALAGNKPAASHHLWRLSRPLLDRHRHRGAIQPALAFNNNGPDQRRRSSCPGLGCGATPAIHLHPRRRHQPLDLGRPVVSAGKCRAGTWPHRRLRSPAPKAFFRLFASTGTSEVFVSATLFVIVGTGVAAGLAGLSMALGAFVAGLLLAETEFDKAIQTTIEPFKGLLLGIFFFTVGMNIDFRELAREPLWLLACVVGLIGIKSVLLIGLARLFRIPWPAAIEAGLLLGPGGEFAFVGLGLATTFGLVSAGASSFALAVTSITMCLIPLLSHLARRLALAVQQSRPLDPELAVTPRSGATDHAIVVGHGRVGQVVCDMLERHRFPFLAVDSDPRAVTEYRRQGREVYYGDATNPAFLETCGLTRAAAVIVTMHTPAAIDEIVRLVRLVRPDILIVSRARDALHARHLYAIGVTDAVPETIEASLQLSEAALVGLGLPTGPVIASIHQKRDEFRSELRDAAGQAGLHVSRGIRPKTVRGP